MRTPARRPLSQRPQGPRGLLVAALGAVLACGGSRDAGSTSPPPTSVGGYGITWSSTALTIEQGDAGTFTASVARSGSFGGSVQLSGEKLPDGVTLTPVSIEPGNTTTTLRVGVRISVPVGAYSFTVRARGAGVADQTRDIALMVTGR